MPPSIRRAVLLAGVSCALWFVRAPQDASALIVPYDLGKLARKSERILTGEVVELHSYRAPFLNLGEVIFTDVKIRIDDTIKGQPHEKEVTVQVLGGTIGDSYQRCPDSPRYTKGEKVLVFLRTYQGRLWNTGWYQGKYRLLQGEEDETFVKGARGLPIAEKTLLADVEARIRAILYPPSSQAPQPSGASPEGGTR